MTRTPSVSVTLSGMSSKASLNVDIVTFVYITFATVGPEPSHAPTSLQGPENIIVSDSAKFS